MKAKPYLISAGVGLAIAAGVFLLRCGGATPSGQDILRIASDACFVSGLLLLGLGLLSVTAHTGQFDTLSYGARSLMVLFTSLSHPEDHPSYLEYKQSRNARRRKPRSYLLWVGGFWLLLALGFLAAYEFAG